MKKKKGDYQDLRLEVIIIPEHAMRNEIPEESILNLIESIIKYGLIHPITVTPYGPNYEVIAGMRRYIAFERMERPTIPCIIMESTNEQTLMRRYIENMERENVNVLDEALFIQTMMETLKLNGKQVAERIGRSDQYVSDRVAVMKYHPGKLIP